VPKKGTIIGFDVKEEGAPGGAPFLLTLEFEWSTEFYGSLVATHVLTPAVPVPPMLFQLESTVPVSVVV